MESLENRIRAIRTQFEIEGLIMKKIMSYFNLLPLSFKLILGFTVICVIIIFF